MHVCRSCCSSCTGPATLNALSNLAFCGDPGLTTVNLSGIANGGSGAITITATSSNTSHIPNPTVTYTSPNTTGSIQFTPTAGISTCATPDTISVKASSTCGSTVRTFTVAISQKVTPTLNPISNVGPIAHGSANQTVNLAGIGPGACNTNGSMSISATSSNTAVSAVVSTSYTNPATTGSIVISVPAAGTATISVTATDGNGSNCHSATTITQTFTVTVT